MSVAEFYDAAGRALDELLVGLDLDRPALYIGLPPGEAAHVWAIANHRGILLAPRCAGGRTEADLSQD